jgi:hypothetical protein
MSSATVSGQYLTAGIGFWTHLTFRWTLPVRVKVTRNACKIAAQSHLAGLIQAKAKLLEIY